MGLFDKVKSILFDEEEVEIPVIKKEPKKEIKKEIEKEEENPIKEIKVPKEDFSDRDNYKSETTFTFPIDFEDEEPIKEERPKPKVEEYKPVKKVEKKDYSDFLSRKEEKKKFKPTPIISPVYGVLDQNYKKEDVIVKKDILRKPSELTLEEVRKRAFGTLEDDLEQNLVSEDVDVIKTKEEVKIKKEQIIEKKKDIIEVEKPVDKLKTIGELIEEDSMSIDIPDIDSIKIDEVDDNNNSTTIIEEEPKNSIEDLLDIEDNVIEEENNIDIEDKNEIDEEEEDLFSLIDSMYEEKGE